MNLKSLRIVIIGFVLLLLPVAWFYFIVNPALNNESKLSLLLVAILCIALYGLSFIGFFIKRPEIISYSFKIIVLTGFLNITLLKNFPPDYSYSYIFIVFLLSLIHIEIKHFIYFFLYSFALLISFTFFVKEPLIHLSSYIPMFIASGIFMFFIFRLREKLQQEMEKAHTDAQAILQCSYGMFFYLDEKYRIVSCNKNAEKNLSVALKKEIKPGNLIFDYVPQANINSLRETLDKCYKGEIIKNEKKIFYPETFNKWTENIFIPIYNNNKLTGVSFQIIDITERIHFEEELKSSLREKEILLSEIHHRVKNNLQVISSLLRLQSYNVSDENIMEVFKIAQNRLFSMSLIHEKLYKAENFSSINIAEYISNLVDSIASSYDFDNNKIHFVFNVESFTINLDTLVPFGLIINELVTNALKHAFTKEQKGTIEITFRKSKDNKFNLCIKDDGIGIAKDIDIENIQTLGLKLVQILTSQINGDFEIIKNDKGSQFNINFEELKKRIQN